MKTIKIILKAPILWILRLKPIYKLTKWLYLIARYEYCKKISYGRNPKLDNVFSDLTVKNGPFKGMKYPGFMSCGSSIYPKLLGYYEPELDSIFETINNKQYSEIIDIGCAEGYYAVGLAIKHKSAKVYAYDTNQTALVQCKKMATLNSVDDRIIIGNFFSDKDLENFNFTGNSLIICDCEGYENELFNKNNITNLKNVELLIELHDFVNFNISNNLIELFKPTHNYTTIRSMDDQLKMNKQLSNSGYLEIKNMSIEDQFQAVAECRGQTMEWLYLTPR